MTVWKCLRGRLALGSLLASVPLAALHAAEPAKAVVNADGSVAVPAFTLPWSPFASEQARKNFAESPARDASVFISRPPSADIAEQRRIYDARYVAPAMEKLRARFAVTITAERIGGVQTDVVVPKSGISPENERRVLINLHGGGFLYGARGGGQLESIPLAGLSRIKVVTVDYREAPEASFPAASEDVAAVYRELLKQYPAENIGLYGCSAGGLLATEAVAWFQKEGLPRPGAIGVFCAGAVASASGDSSYSGPVVSGGAPRPVAGADMPVSNYFKPADLRDPLASPVYAPTTLAKFPPTLVITGTRDLLMSDAVHTHAELVKAGADAELHVWDGMRHGFLFYDDVDTPEATEAWNVIAAFFARHLGSK